MNCPQCQATLLVDVFPSATSVRCTSCSAIAPRVAGTSAEANRLAWRSFWLGLSSIVLLPLTGLPAIWYGVQSLLQMRFVRSQKHDRKAAIAGISLGVFFGVIASCFLGIAGGFALVFSLAMEQTTDPQRVEVIGQMIGTMELPPEFKPAEARRVSDQFQRATWEDGSTADSANGRIRFIKTMNASQIGQQQLRGPVVRFKLNETLEIEESPDQATTLTWKFAGVDTGVVRVRQEVDDKPFSVLRYTAVTDERFDQKYRWAVVVSIREAGKYSEADVRKMVESFVPAMGD